MLADQMKVDELIEYFADDAVMELPFAPGRMAKRYEGKDAILGFQQFARDSFSTFSMTVDAIHETADPHVVIAEHRSDGVVAANGRRYAEPLLHDLHVRRRRPGRELARVLRRRRRRAGVQALTGSG